MLLAKVRFLLLIVLAVIVCALLLLSRPGRLLAGGLRSTALRWVSSQRGTGIDEGGLNRLQRIGLRILLFLVFAGQSPFDGRSRLHRLALPVVFLKAPLLGKRQRTVHGGRGRGLPVFKRGNRAGLGSVAGPC